MTSAPLQFVLEPPRKMSPTFNKAVLIACFSGAMLLCAAGANAVMDVLQFRYAKSVFVTLPNQQWWDPKKSWTNKWRNGDPRQGEAFFLSSTTLVALTDAWHAAKTIMLQCISLAILAPFTLLFRAQWGIWVLALLAISLVFGGIFELLFAHVLIIGK